MAILSSLVGARVNGLYYDYTSIEIVIADIGVQANITEINYSAKRDPGVFRGTSSLPRGRTRGTFDFDGDFTIYKEDFELIKQRLSADPNGFMVAAFDISVDMSEAGANIPVTDTVLGANIISVDNSFSQGNDPLLVKVGLSIMNIKFNGVPVINTIQKTVSSALRSAL